MELMECVTHSPAVNIARVLLVSLLTVSSCANQNYTSKTHPLGEGHGKPFGKGRPSSHVEVISRQLMGQEFFSKFVVMQKPLLMKGLVSNSSSKYRWSDGYFLSLNGISDTYVMGTETRKESLAADPVQMAFTDFVKTYNASSRYLVDTIPPFLRDDVQIPGVVQCKKLVEEALVEFRIWFSSGGTKSIVHTDSAENLNCVVDGSKRFVFIPPKYRRHVPLRSAKYSYSGVDVDAVDYDKYPGLAEVEFLHADMEPGDCLYVPYKWIHQVTSFNRSLAFNIWWDPSINRQLNLQQCNHVFDPKWTLSNATFKSLENIDITAESVRDEILEIAEFKAVNLDEMIEMLNLTSIYDEEFKQSEYFNKAMDQLTQAFEKIDTDSNGIIEESNVLAIDPTEWEDIASHFETLGRIDDEYESSSLNVNKSDRDEL